MIMHAASYYKLAEISDYEIQMYLELPAGSPHFFSVVLPCLDSFDSSTGRWCNPPVITAVECAEELLPVGLLPCIAVHTCDINDDTFFDNKTSRQQCKSYVNKQVSSHCIMQVMALRLLFWLSICCEADSAIMQRKKQLQDAPQPGFIVQRHQHDSVS